MSTDELTDNVSKMVELNKQIREARSDIKVLVNAEKELKSQIKHLMIDNGLDVINLKTGKISVKTSVKKSGLNKTTVKEGLEQFFQGNREKTETALKVILDNLPTKESSVISLTGLNK